jgi:hypothetical protein
MFCKRRLRALGVMTLVAAGLSFTARTALTDGPQPTDNQRQAAQPSATVDKYDTSGKGCWYLLPGDCIDPRQLDIRFGYWGSHTAGSPVRVGEYQDLEPSPFYDVDWLSSDGCRTLNATITGTDSETNAVGMNFYRPGFQANVDYQRFPHNYGHENLGEFVASGPSDNTDNGAKGTNVRTQQFLRQDLNPGDDYAFRVQEFKSSFKGRLTDDLKLRLDVWGMYKEGERDARAMQECYPHTSSTVDPNGAPPPFQSSGSGSTRHCHVLAQAQHIDWETTEFKPVIEWNLGALVIEYSRPMRVFSQNDQLAWRYYDQRGSTSTTSTGEFGQPRFMDYGVVPDNFTQIDQIKVSATLNDSNRLYAFLFNGNTRKSSDIATPVANPVTADFPAIPAAEGDERISNRRFDGADVRWTNTDIENVTITTYGRIVEEDNQPAAFVIPGEETRLPPNDPFIEDNPTEIVPINYRRTQVGARVLWRPFGRGYGLGGLAINGNYEYGIIHRVGLAVDTGSDDPPFDHAPLVEEDTHSHTISFGPSVRWSPELDTYVRYKWYNAQSPLFATNSHESPDATTGLSDYRALALNSALPTHDNLIEIGGTWMPTDRFMLNAWFGIDIQTQNLGRALVEQGTAPVTDSNRVTPLDVPMNSDSQSFPFGINGCYRASDKWTFNGGAAYYTNFIDQDVAFGAGADHGYVPYGLLTNRWSYGGRTQVYNLGGTYAVTCRVRLIGQIEYVKGIESAYELAGDPRTFDPAPDTAGIPRLIRQDVATTRLTMGIDYQIRPRVSTYFRYVLYDYDDKADNARIAASTQPTNGLPLSGTSNVFLTGLSAYF